MAQRQKRQKWTTAIIPSLLKKIKAEAKREDTPLWYVLQSALQYYFATK